MHFSRFVLMVFPFLLHQYAHSIINNSHKYAEVLVNFENGKVLHSKNIDERIYPASLTKMMLLLIVFKQIEMGKLSLNDKLVISKHANNKPPSRLHVKSGDKILVRDAVYSVITKSANNVACALAEKISGSEQRFADLMNTYCRRIGLNNTHFTNASGLFNKNHYSTARDIAKLSLCLMKSYPERYHFFKTKNFKYNGQTYMNHNKLLGKRANNIFVDGIKTGYTYNSGFNIVISATRNNKRLIAIVIGSDTSSVRNRTASNLLDNGFKMIDKSNNIRLVRKDIKESKKKNKKMLKY